MILEIKYLRTAIYAFATLLVVSLIAYAVYWSATLPKRDPQRLLEIEEKVTQFFNELTLPIKVAQMTAQEPDQTILMPVYGIRVTEISDTWAAPRGDDRVHEGQDIFADRGTPVFSATTGYVIRTRSNNLGGNVVYILGPGGRRYYYAHLDRHADGISVGDKVTTDTVIGFVGNTGNAENTPAHLHFGVYESREAINPLPLIINR